MRPVVEDEADAGLPALLEGDVGQPLLGRAVVPQREVRVAVGVVGRRPRLHTVHAPPALEPASDNFRPLIHCGASIPSRCFILFSLGSSGYQTGWTVSALSAQRPVEHVKNALQNIMTEWAPQCTVYSLLAFQT